MNRVNGEGCAYQNQCYSVIGAEAAAILTCSCCDLPDPEGRDRYLERVIDAISIHIVATPGSWVRVDKIVTSKSGDLSAIRKVGDLISFLCGWVESIIYASALGGTSMFVGIVHPFVRRTAGPRENLFRREGGRVDLSELSQIPLLLKLLIHI